MQEDNHASYGESRAQDNSNSGTEQPSSISASISADLKKEDSGNATCQEENAQEEPNPPHLFRLWRFLIDPRHSNAVVAIFTLLLFITTTIYTVFAALQWLTMKETLSAMKSSGNVATEQTWRAIDNMNWIARGMDGSLLQTQKALQQAHNNFVSDQRPWVFMNAIVPEPDTPRDPNGLFAVGKSMYWRVYFSNYGRTPAINLVVKWSYL